MKVKRERGWTGNSWGGISLGPPDPGPNGGKQTHTVASLYKDSVMQDRFMSICLAASGCTEGKITL